jgi:hypothetical protein
MALAYFCEGTSCQLFRVDAALPLSRRKDFSKNALAGFLIAASIDYLREHASGRATWGSASEGPIAMPSTSRVPSVFMATAIITATDTIRPASRTFRYVAPVALEALTRSSISVHSRETWLLLIPLMPIDFTGSSTERVEIPCT